MKNKELKKRWLEEEASANICGWDFSHIEDRYEEVGELSWDYRQVIGQYLLSTHELFDMDTGGGEFLLSPNHPPERCAATEGYPPNVALCREKLLPLGIDFRPVDESFEDNRFDVVLNRHGSFEPAEVWRILKPGGVFITQQVGEDNDRELVELLLPGTSKPYPGWSLEPVRKSLMDQGFDILRGEEAFRPIRFYDVGALVWFARIIEWEFPGFSVENCLPQLSCAQNLLERNGKIEGKAHRFLVVAQKPKN